MFQTDSDEDVVFVFERCAHKPIEITIDQAKRLALQRDVDQQSQPQDPAKPLSSERLVAEGRQAEMVKMTMEEEKCEEKPIKKEKKHKKGQANDGSLAVVKKEPKKGKMADAGLSVEKGEQKKKKKKTDSLNAANGSEVTDGKGVKKKKKKKLLADIKTHVEIAQSLVNEEEVEKKQKKIKAKNKSTQIKQENIVKEEEEEQQVGKDNLPKKVKKEKKHILDISTELTKEQMKEEKKKKKKLLTDYETQLKTAQSLVKEDVEKKQKKKVKNKSTQIKCENIINEEDEQQVGKKSPQKKGRGKKPILDVSTEVTEEPMKEKKKKQKCPLTVDEGTVTTKKKAKVAENGIKLETLEYENGDVKRKKKETKTKEGNGEETTEIKGKTKKSKAVSDKVEESEKQEKSTNVDFVHMDEGKTEIKKKAKKDKCKITTMEAAKTEEEEPKKKKRKRVNHEEKPLLDKSEEVQEDKQRRESLCKADETPKKKSKKKKSSAQVEHVREGGVEPVAKKKKKIKQEQENPAEIPQVDVVFLSERSGNTDEITINQERRQALQMEVDKASQPQTVKPTGFGQWSTARFDSSEQQQKFLRLMGGFKKGFQPAVTSTGGANMALGKDAQQQLQQNLLGEFERAQSRRMDLNNRGAGLGFSAPSNKKFSIDINASRSVRFDD